ncbi:MAG: hypothetical protein Kow00128_11480 [Deltaproteobacteria bacterium]
MRSSSNASKALAVVLSSFLSLTGGTVPYARGEGGGEPCLLLKVASGGIPESAAREALTPLPALLEAHLAVRWIHPEALEEGGRDRDLAEPFPEPDPAALEEISRRLAEANRRMEQMETDAADRLLREAEDRSRSVRFGPVIRPYLAEIFFRQGILHLWKGEGDRCRERFARSYTLRPDFDPEPALYSPAVREAWERSKGSGTESAELLVQSIPSGGTIFLDGRRAGVTPGKVTVEPAGRVRVRVEREGYRAAERTTQWLPGDSGMLEFTLERDPASDLPAMLSADPEGSPTGRMLEEMARRAGATRVAVLMVEEGGSESPVLRILALKRGEERPSLLGALSWPSGERAAERVAEEAAGLLAKAGWPVKTAVRKPARPWYHTWWFWTVMVSVVAGIAAAGAGGGGGSSGSSTGTIGVTF